MIAFVSPPGHNSFLGAFYKFCLPVFSISLKTLLLKANNQLNIRVSKLWLFIFYSRAIGHSSEFMQKRKENNICTLR